MKASLFFRRHSDYAAIHRRRRGLEVACSFRF